MDKRSLFCLLMLLVFLTTVIDARPIQTSQSEVSASEAQEARVDFSPAVSAGYISARVLDPPKRDFSDGLAGG
jgi:hypothetical protein